MGQTKTRPVGIYILFVLVAFQGLSGVFGGTALVIDPSGTMLHIPISLLEGSPFGNYFIPGLILLTILGIFPLIVLKGLWKRSGWGWLGSLMVAIALIIWIGVEILMIGYQSQPPLQLIYGKVGILILIFTILPSVKNHFRK